ncbi:MAG: hypothetical protein RL240_2481 [Planctomycetota bacterium]|jgi:hypothetical protein
MASRLPTLAGKPRHPEKLKLTCQAFPLPAGPGVPHTRAAPPRPLDRASPTRALLPLARWRERGPGGEGGVRANPSAPKTYATPITMCATGQSLRPIPSQKQPLRGPSPHPQPLSPTRGEGSKTVKPRAQIPGENSADRPRAATH